MLKFVSLVILFTAIKSELTCVSPKQTELPVCGQFIDHDFPSDIEIGHAEKSVQESIYALLRCPIAAATAFECGERFPLCEMRNGKPKVRLLCSSDCQKMKDLCSASIQYGETLDCTDSERFSSSDDCLSMPQHIASPCSFANTLLREAIEAIVVVLVFLIGSRIHSFWKARRERQATEIQMQTINRDPLDAEEAGAREIAATHSTVSNTIGQNDCDSGEESEETEKRRKPVAAAEREKDTTGLLAPETNPEDEDSAPARLPTIAMTEESEYDGPAECRICRMGDEDGKLISPCLCKGSMALVHSHCLQSWMETRGETPNAATCEVCHDPYRIIMKRQITCSSSKACSSRSWGEYFSCTTLMVTVPFLPVMNWMLCTNKAQNEIAPDVLGGVVFTEIVMIAGFFLAFKKTFQRWHAANHRVVVTEA